MARMKLFPQEIYITVDQTDDEDVMLAHRSKTGVLDSDEDQAVIGVYKFVSAEELKRELAVRKRKGRGIK